VAAFSLLLVPVFGMFFYAERFGPNKEDLEETIRARYDKQELTPDQLKQKQAMAEFFQKAIMNPNDDKGVDVALNEVLKAGKSSSARETTRRALPTTTDKKSNISEETTTVTTIQTQSSNNSDSPLQAASENVTKRTKKRKKEAAAIPINDDESLSSTNASTATTNNRPISETTKSALLLTGVAALAAGIGYMAGGKRQ
jgi:hypothetical protein